MSSNRSGFLRWGAPALLLAVAVLAFGLLIPWLGFYWDDWAKILVARLYGLGGYYAYYAGDRPLSSWTHVLFTPLVGQGPIGWQILTFLLRFLSAWAMLWVLNTIWPHARRQNLIATLFFLVYPAFLQQSVALTFHQQWLQFFLYFVSLGAMLRAAQAPWGTRAFASWSILSLITMLLQISVTEYFVPLELLRPLLLWVGFSAERTKKRLEKTLRSWTPYLVILAAFTTWRLFFFNNGSTDPYRANTLFSFLSSPLPTLKNQLLTVAVDEANILVSSWTGLFQINLLDVPRFQLISYALGILGGVLVAFFLFFGLENDEQSGSHNDDWLKQVLLLGLAAVLLGPVPAWITGRQVVFDAHSDRYALPAMFGAGLLVAAGVEWLAQKRVQRAVVVGVLVALAISLHLRTANTYRWIWTDQLRTYWQLYWRAPRLEPGTAVFFETEPFPNQGLFSTSSALNLLYAQEKKTDPETLDLDYWVYALLPRWSQAPGTMVKQLGTRFRTLVYSGTTLNSLIVYKDPQGSNCLWVLTPEDGGNPDLPEVIKTWLPISRISQIVTVSTEQPARDQFGPEPEHNWCYYYQKAALAKQMLNWKEAARLADEAMAKGYLPSRSGSDRPFEWLPMIEGLVNEGRWEEAALLSQLAYQSDNRYAGMFCQLWARELSLAQGEAEASLVVINTQKSIGCQAP